nr:hypothetical protein [Tanacetum cinerariifolium]
MTGNLKLLTNFVEKFLGTVKFGNDQIAQILGYGDLVQGTITIKRVYYVKGLNYNLFFVGQFCDADLEVAFRKSTCYIRDLKGNDLITCSRGTGYSTQSRVYRVFNKITRIIFKTIHVNFDELPQMASDHVSSDPVPQCPTTALEHVSLSPGPQSQENVSHAAETVTTSNELALLYSLMFDELLNGTTQVMSKSSAVTTTDAPNQHQQQHTAPSTSTTVAADTPPLNIQTTPEPTCQEPTQAPTVNATDNINQAEIITKNAQVEDEEFINIFSTPVQERGETSTRHSIRTRRQLETDDEMCMFALTVSRTEPKNIKEAMADSTWIEAMQEEIHQFDRLDIHQSLRGIFINQAKHAQKILKKHGMTSCDSIGTLMATKHLDADLSAKPTEKHPAVKRIFRYLKDTINIGLWYPKDTGFKLTVFSDSDHAGCLDSRKSTSSGIQFLGGDKLVTWSSKKLDYTSISLAEAEYVSLSACCAQVLWLKTQVTDYGFHFDKIPIYHFIKEKVEEGIVEIFFVRTEYQLADLFTKALSEDRFKYLVRKLGMRCLTPEELEVLTNESA